MQYIVMLLKKKYVGFHKISIIIYLVKLLKYNKILKNYNSEYYLSY
jgi:hypothetical protein